jgi:hypothetical protein
MAWFRKWLAGLLKWLAFLEMHLYSALFFASKWWPFGNWDGFLAPLDWF